MNEQQFIFADEDAWLPDNPGEDPGDKDCVCPSPDVICIYGIAIHCRTPTCCLHRAVLTGFPLNGVLSPRTMSLDATFLQCLAGVDTNNGGGLLSPFDREHSLDLSTWAPNHDCMSPRLGEHQQAFVHCMSYMITWCSTPPTAPEHFTTLHTDSTP